MPAAPNNSLFTAAPIAARQIVEISSAGLVLDDDPDAYSDWDGKPAWWTFRVPKQMWLIFDAPNLDDTLGFVQLSVYRIEDGDAITYNNLDYDSGSSIYPLSVSLECEPNFTYFIHMDSDASYHGNYAARYRPGVLTDWVEPEPIIMSTDIAPIPPGVAGPWTSLDLSTAVFGTNGVTPYGKYEGGAIVTNTGWPDFWFPGLDLDETKNYEFEVTYANPVTGGDTNNTGYFGMWGISSYSQAGYSGFWYDLFDTYYSTGMKAQQWSEGGNTVGITIVGSAYELWQNADFFYGDVRPFFETSRYNACTSIRYREAAVQNIFQFGTFSTGEAQWNITPSVVTATNTLSTAPATSLWNSVRGAGGGYSVSRNISQSSYWLPQYFREGNDDVAATRLLSVRYMLFSMGIFPLFSDGGDPDDWPVGAQYVVPDYTDQHHFNYTITATNIVQSDPYGGAAPSVPDTLRVDPYNYAYNSTAAPFYNAAGTGNQLTNEVSADGSTGYKQFIVVPAKVTDPTPPTDGGVAPYKNGVRYSHDLHVEIEWTPRRYRFLYVADNTAPSPGSGLPGVAGGQDLGRAGFW